VSRERSIVGFDVVELCPSAGPSSCAFVAAKLAYKVMGYATERRGSNDEEAEGI
jgi:agmatinase